MRSWGNTIETGNSDLLNTYTDVQQSITQALKNALGSEYNTSTYYMLFTNEPASNGDGGFMPLKRQFGFVFDGTSRTLAHELGHGIFGLQHPFSKKEDERKTKLLMDYGSGEILSHNDWEIMHAPGLQLYQFTQGSSAGALAGGYGLTPDWRFVRTNESTILSGSQVPIVGEGMLGGFESTENGKTINYIWNTTTNTYKIDGKGADYDKVNYKDVLGDKVVVWLIYKNNQECSKRKYIRTYYSQIKADLPKHDLTLYIAKIDKIAKAEKLEIYSNTLGCVGNNTSGNGSGNYNNYLVTLGENANKTYTEDKTDVGTQTAHVFDLATVITTEEKQKILGQLGGINSGTGILCKIYLIDANTPKEKRNEITDYLGSLKGKEIGLLIDFTDAKNPAINTFLGDGIEGSGNDDVNKFLSLLSKVIPKFDGTYTYFNPLTAMLDGIASVVTKAKIPERFYNPEITTKDYNPILYYVSLVDPFSFSTLLGDQVLKQNNIIITNSKLVNATHIYFAFKCGVWNGFVDQVKGLAEMAAIITNLIDGGDRAGEMWEGIKKLDIFCTESKDGNVCIWSLVKKAHTGQVCQIAETLGYDVANIVTIAISFAKVGKVAQISKVIESLDVMSQAMKLAGKFIKVTIKGSGNAARISFSIAKAFMKPGLKLAKADRTFSMIIPVAIDLSENIDNAVNKAKELLKKTPEELEEKLTILSEADADGNLIAEITDGNTTTKVLLNESEEQLRKSANEIVSDAIDIVAYKKSLISKGLSKISELSDEVLKRVKQLDESYLVKLESDLSSNSSGEKIKDLLSTVDDVDIWKILKDDPGLAWQIARENPLWDKWSKGNFFKTVTKAGKEFEELVKNQLKDLNSQVYQKLKSKIADLDQRTILSQVQFCLTAKAPCNAKGEYFIPDFVAVREIYDPILKKNILDVIIFDTKLSKGTSWSPNQTIAQKMEGWVIKSVNNENILKGTKIKGFEYNASVLKNGSFKKIFKEGTEININ